MSLRAAFDHMVNANEVPGCKVARIRADLPAEDREFLDTITGVTPTEIARLLRADGHMVANSTVRAHYRGDCTCGTR